MTEETTTAAALKKKQTYKEMTIEALHKLKERGGSTLHAISKYVSSNYDIPMDARSRSHLKRYLVKGCTDGDLIAVSKGVGAKYKLSRHLKNKLKPKKKKKAVNEDGQTKASTSNARKNKPKLSAKAKVSTIPKEKKEKVEKAAAVATTSKKAMKKTVKKTDKKSKATAAKVSKDKQQKPILKRASLIGGMVTTKLTKKPKKMTKKKGADAIDAA